MLLALRQGQVLVHLPPENLVENEQGPMMIIDKLRSQKTWLFDTLYAFI